MPNQIVDVIKNRVRQAMNEVLTNATDQKTRPARVTVVRTVRNAPASGSPATTLVKVYRILEDLKSLIGDLDRIVVEAKSLFPSKPKRSSSKKGSSKKAAGAKAGRRGKRGAAKARGGSRRGARRGARRGGEPIERTTMDAETAVRRAV